MHWMPVLAETYILNRVKEEQEERQRCLKVKAEKDQSVASERCPDKMKG